MLISLRTFFYSEAAYCSVFPAWSGFQPVSKFKALKTLPATFFLIQHIRQRQRFARFCPLYLWPPSSQRTSGQLLLVSSAFFFDLPAVFPIALLFGLWSWSRTTKSLLFLLCSCYITCDRVIHVPLLHPSALGLATALWSRGTVSPLESEPRRKTFLVTL